MIEIKLFLTGKHKESWIEEAFLEFKKRLSRTILLEEVWLKDEKSLFLRLEEEKEVILLDPLGKLMTSPEFATFLQKRGARIAFAIGGPMGFPEALRQNRTLISLSPLTFTHQIARLVLMEQIYRAHEIWRNSPYPR